MPLTLCKGLDLLCPHFMMKVTHETALLLPPFYRWATKVPGRCTSRTSLIHFKVLVHKSLVISRCYSRALNPAQALCAWTVTTQPSAWQSLPQACLGEWRRQPMHEAYVMWLYHNHIVMWQVSLQIGIFPLLFCTGSLCVGSYSPLFIPQIFSEWGQW